MIKPPYTKWINDIKTKLGFNRTMTASGADVVDAVNKQSQQIDALGQRVINGSIGNLETLYLNRDYTTIYIYRFFNNYNKAGIYAHDFSNTVGTVYSTFDASEFTMSYNNTTGWTIKNNINGALSYVAIQ